MCIGDVENTYTDKNSYTNSNTDSNTNVLILIVWAGDHHNKQRGLFVPAGYELNKRKRE